MTPNRRAVLRRATLVVGAVLGIVGLVWMASRVVAQFPTATTLLSQGSECDIEPRAAISSDGQWIAAAWIRGRQIGYGCVSRGDPVIRWAAEGAAQAGWTATTVLQVPTSMACAVHTDVAVHGTTAHVAVSYWLPCDALERGSGVRYYTCDLVSQSCQSHGDVVFYGETSGKLLSDVRIVVDDQGLPHIAYARGDAPGLANGDIVYARRKADQTWAPPVVVSTGTKIHGFYRPAIAHSQGRIHFVWERHRNWTDNQDRQRNRGDVQYRRCEAATGVCWPEQPITFPYPDGNFDDTTYPIPNIAARNGRVIIAWNVCADVDTAPPCESFYLLYTRSNDNGTTLISIPKEVGSDLPVNQVVFASTRQYPGSDDWAGLSTEYASYARPSVAIDEELMPHVAWQMAEASGYVISTTHAYTGTFSSFSWSSDEGWGLGAGADTRVAAAVLPVASSLDPGALHVVHMSAWLEEYAGTPWSRAQVYYDYLGLRQPVLSVETPTSNHELPVGRAHIIRARVTNLAGDPIADTQVAFSTTYGSFSYAGYGMTATTSTTNGDGWAEAGLYSNLPGAADVTVWLDADQDLAQDEGEATETVSRSWTASVAPDLHAGADWVMAGDLITGTVVYHPYETLDWPEQPTPYVLWWCPKNGGQPAKMQIADPFEVDIQTWGVRDMLLQVPWLADGEYRLESFVDYGYGDPCGSVEVLAESTYVDVKNAPPPGTPWLTVNDPRPGPGEVINVTFLSHNPGDYELWWCPASGDAAPVAEQVAATTVPSGVDPTVPARVPSGASGFYRLESHNPGGACGQPATRVATSALLAPESNVSLPLIMRSY